MLPVSSQAGQGLFKTGDHFTFVGDASGMWNDYRDFDMINASNSNQAFRIERHTMNSAEDLSTNSEISLVKDVNSPFGFFPTVAISENERYVISGTHSGSDALFDMGQGSQWFNNTWSDSNTGESYHEKDFMPIMSNDSYVVVFPEMEQNQIPAQVYLPIRPENTDLMFPQFPNATLSYRQVTTGTETFIVNGVSQSINYKNITSEFSYTFYDDFNFTMPFGPEDDPNTPYRTLNASISISSYATYSYVFDTSNGMLVEIYESRYTYIDISAWGNNIDITTPEGFVMYADVSLNFGNSEEFENHSFLDTISMLYGNERAVSSGTNRLMENDMLYFTVSGNNNFAIDDGFNTFNGGGDVSGTAMMDVYYHEPGYFAAVFQLNAQFYPIGGVALDDHDMQMDNRIFELDLIDTPSNDTYEIYPFIDENMHFEPPNLQPQQGPMTLDDHDFGRIPIDDTSMPLQNTNTYQSFESFLINGYEYVVDLHTIEGVYERTGQFTVYSDYFQTDVTVILEITGFQYMAYDSATGVLMERGEEVSGLITLTPHYEFEDGPTTQVKFENNFYLTVDKHPYLYQEAQTELPPGYTDDHTDDHHDDSTPNNDSEALPGLDLPFTDSLVPIMGTLAFITVIVNRKRS